MSTCSFKTCESWKWLRAKKSQPFPYRSVCNNRYCTWLRSSTFLTMTNTPKWSRAVPKCSKNDSVSTSDRLRTPQVALGPPAEHPKLPNDQQKGLEYFQQISNLFMDTHGCLWISHYKCISIFGFPMNTQRIFKDYPMSNRYLWIIHA